MKDPISINLSNLTQEQLEIKKWFDMTYSKWGFMYLRPQPAYEIFGTILDTKQGGKHLDVACGLGLMLKTMSNRGINSYGVDLSEEAIKKAAVYCPEANIQHANAEELPFEDGIFDSLSCIGSLERMLDRRKVLKEQSRVVKDDGKLCLMVRNSEHFVWRYIWKPFGIQNKKGHQDAMNLEEWTALFEEVGLKVEKVYPDHWPYYKIKRFFTFGKLDTSKIRKFPFGIKSAYEFIFVLTKI